jgi:hypothetical protein
MSSLLTRPLHAGLDAVVQMFHLGGEGHRAEIIFMSFCRYLRYGVRPLFTMSHISLADGKREG